MIYVSVVVSLQTAFICDGVFIIICLFDVFFSGPMATLFGQTSTAWSISCGDTRCGNRQLILTRRCVSSDYMFDFSSSGASVDQSSKTRRQAVTSGTAKDRSICQILGPAGSICLLVLARRLTEKCMPRTRLNGSSPETSSARTLRFQRQTSEEGPCGFLL